jgi:hypothetical protein
LETHGYVVSFSLNRLKDKGVTLAYCRDPRSRRIHAINQVRYRRIGFYVNYGELLNLINDMLPFTGYETLAQLWGAYHMISHLRYNTYALYYVHEGMLPEILRAMIA